MLELIVMLLFFALSAFFSMAETAITSVPRIKLNHLVEQKIPGARLLRDIKEHPSQFLSTILFGNNLVNIAAASLATMIVIQLMERLGAGGLGTAVGVVTGVMTLLILIFGEIIPKTVAMRNSETIALFIAPLIWGLQILLKPIVYLLEVLTRPFIFIFGGVAPQKGSLMTEEEIRSVLAIGEREGVIEEEEREMITSIFDFGDTVAREVMTPRPDIVAVEVNQSQEEIKKAIFESGHSRIPVYEGNLENIVGVVYAKDLLASRDNSIRDHLRQALFIPETKKLPDLLHEMQAARTHIAIIVDEYGTISGLISMEDMIEEIVGEIHDEFERGEKNIDKIDSNTIIVDGKVPLSELNDQLGIVFPEGEHDTVAGFVFGQLSKVPAVGDTVHFENLLVSVERIHRRRITRVKIVKLPGDDEETVGG